MDVVTLSDSNAVCAAGAAVIAAQIRRKPGSVVGLATGKTMERVYAALRALDWSRVTTFNLDEFVGETTFHEQMQKWLFDYVRVREAYFPCTAYERLIARAGGIDLQLLGLGENAHIAFNEPGSPFDSRTRVTTLVDGRLVMTMGIATIMDARSCLLLAYGRAKADAVRALLKGPVSEAAPASVLQRHRRVTVIIDEAAAACL